MADSTQTYKVELDVKNFDQNVNKLISELKDLQSQIAKTGEGASQLGTKASGGMSKFSSLAGGMKSNWLAITGAIGGAVIVFDKLNELFGESVKRVIAEEAFETKLNFAVQQNNTLFERNLKLRDQLNQNPLFEKDEINAAILYTQEMGRTTKQSEDMIKAAMGLSRVTGTDLQTAMATLNGTLEGTKGRLGRVSNEVKNMTQAQLLNGDAIGAILKKYGEFGDVGGKLEIQTKTLSKSWEEFTESLRPAVEWLSKGVQYIFEFIKAAGSIPVMLANMATDEGIAIAKFTEATVKKTKLQKQQSQEFQQALRKDKDVQAAYLAWRETEEGKAALKSKDRNDKETDWYGAYLIDKGKLDEQNDNKKKALAKAGEAARKKAEEEQQKENERIIENEKKNLEETKKLHEDSIKQSIEIDNLAIQNKIDNAKIEYETGKKGQSETIAELQKYYKEREDVINRNLKLEIDNVQSQIDEINKIQGPLSENQLQQRKNLEDQLVLINQKGNKQIQDNTKQSYEDQKSIIKDSSDKIVAAHKEIFDKIAQLGQLKTPLLSVDKLKQGINDLRKEKEKIDQEYKDGLISKEVWQKTTDEADKGIQDLSQKITDLHKKVKEDVSNVLGEIGNLFGTISQIIQQGYQNQLDKIDAQYTKQYENLDNLKNKGIITEKQYNAQKEKLLKEQTAKENAIKREQAKKQREADILQAIVSGAIGIIQATNAEPPLDIILPIIIGAITAAQIGLILSKPLPEFKKGGPIPKKYAIGGPITGPTHESGGVPITAEGGEYIINKNVAQKPGMGYLLDNINRGNNPQTAPQPAVIDHAALKTIVQSVVSIPVNVVETDMTRVQRKVNTIETKASW